MPVWGQAIEKKPNKQTNSAVCEHKQRCSARFDIWTTERRPEWMGSTGAKLGEGNIPEGGALEDHVTYGIKDSKRDIHCPGFIDSKYTISCHESEDYKQEKFISKNSSWFQFYIHKLCMINGVSLLHRLLCWIITEDNFCEN